jgi:hypothetical protein
VQCVISPTKPPDVALRILQHLQVVTLILRDIHTKSLLVAEMHQKKVFFQGQNNPRTVVGGRRGRTHFLGIRGWGEDFSESKPDDLQSHIKPPTYRCQAAKA